MELIERLANRYEVQETLGSGGMGTVYAASDLLRGGDPIALKVFEHPDDAEGGLLFQQEFLLASRLRHPNTLWVHDFGRLPDGRRYFTMELVRGQDLSAAIPGTVELAWLVLRQACNVLGFLHRLGYVHSDIKPDNLRMTPEGVLKLMDFGLVGRIGQSGGPIRGTPIYMAPEVLQGGKIDQRTDLYSLGAVLYHLLAGRPPFQGETFHELFKQILTVEPMPLRHYRPELPEELEAIVHRLLHKKPAARFRSPLEVLAAIGDDVSLDTDRTLLNPPMVGREAELRTLLDRIETARSETRFQLAWLVGDSGCGKSRVFEELRIDCQLRDRALLTGECLQGDQVPYAPFLPVVRAGLAFLESRGEVVAIPGLAGLLDPEARGEEALEPQQEKFRRFSAVAELLSRVAGWEGLAVLLDDWQWSDALSRELLTYLARHLRAAPVALLVASREAPATEKFEGESVHRLPPLDEASVLSLCAGIFGEATVDPAFASQLSERSQGNPQIVQEIVSDLVAQGKLYRRYGHWATKGVRLEASLVPGSLRELAEKRLRRLDPAAVELGVLASAIGPRFHLPVLRQVARLPEDRFLDRLGFLMDEGILVQREELFAFASPHWVTILYQRPREEKRAALHAAISRALEDYLGEREPTLEQLAELASHSLKGWRLPQAYEYALKVGEAYLGLYDHERAQAFLNAGYEILEARSDVSRTQEHELQLRYECALGTASRYAGQYDQARERLTLALALARKLGDRLAEATLLNDLGVVAKVQDQYARAIEHLTLGVELASEIALPRQRMRGLVELAWTHALQGTENAAVITVCRQAIALAEEVGSQSHLSKAMGWLGYATAQASPDGLGAGVEHLERAIVLAEGAGDPQTLQGLFMLLGNVSLHVGLLPQADAAFRRNRELTQRLGQRDDELTAVINLAMIAYERGEFEEVIRLVEPSVKDIEAAGNIWLLSWARALQGTAAIRLGRLEGALDQLDRALHASLDIKNVYLQVAVLGFKLEAHVHLGQLTEAEATARQALGLASQHELHEFDLRLQCFLAEAYLFLGVLDEARLLLDRALEHAVRSQAVAARALVEKNLARLAFLSGDHRRASHWVLQARRLAEQCGCRALLSELTLLEARLASQKGERLHALLLSEQAVGHAEGTGDPHLCALALHHLAIVQVDPSLEASLRERAISLLQKVATQLTPAMRRDFLAREDRAEVLNAYGRPTPAEAPGRQSAAPAVASNTLLGLVHNAQQAAWNSIQETFSIIDELFRLLGLTATSDELLQQLAELLHRSSRATRAMLFLADEDGALRLRAQRPEVEAEVTNDRILRYVQTTGETIFIQDVRANGPLTEPGLETRGGLICVPLKVRRRRSGREAAERERVIGALYVDLPEDPRGFTEREVNLLEVLARYAAVVVENALLQEESERRSERLQMIHQLSHAIGSTLDLDSLLLLALGQILALTRGEQGYLFFGAELACRASLDALGQPLSAVTVSNSVIRRVTSERRALCVLDIGRDEELQHQKSILAQNIQSVMCVPLLSQERLLGVVYISSSTTNKTFTEHDLELMVAIAGQVALALENAEAYETIKDLNVGLEAKVHERTQELSGAYEELKGTQEQLFTSEKLAAIGTIAGGIAHEINNPLGAILTNAQLLKLDLVDPEALDTVSLIEEGAHRCRDIVEQLLRYSRPSELQQQPVDLRALLERALALLQIQFQEHRIRTRLIAPEIVPLVLGKESELGQVFTSLLLNARDALVEKFGGRGGGEASIRVLPDGGRIAIEFTDNGTGVSPLIQKRIFDPFFTTKKVGAGQGLGLSVAQKVVEKMGGQILLDSLPGEGTTLTVVLPTTPP